MERCHGVRNHCRQNTVRISPRGFGIVNACKLSLCKAAFFLKGENAIARVCGFHPKTWVTLTNGYNQQSAIKIKI